METDISKLHEGTDGFYYDDFLAPDKAETFVGQLVSTQWWQKGGRFALICNFLAEDGRKIALFAFQKYTGISFYKANIIHIVEMRIHFCIPYCFAIEFHTDHFFYSLCRYHTNGSDSTVSIHHHISLIQTRQHHGCLIKLLCLRWVNLIKGCWRDPEPASA